MFQAQYLDENKNHSVRVNTFGSDWSPRKDVVRATDQMAQEHSKGDLDSSKESFKETLKDTQKESLNESIKESIKESSNEREP